MKSVTALLHQEAERQAEIEARLRKLDANLAKLGHRYAKVGRYLRARSAATVQAA